MRGSSSTKSKNWKNKAHLLYHAAVDFKYLSVINYLKRKKIESANVVHLCRRFLQQFTPIWRIFPWNRGGRWCRWFGVIWEIRGNQVSKLFFQMFTNEEIFFSLQHEVENWKRNPNLLFCVKYYLLDTYNENLTWTIDLFIIALETFFILYWN